jgi:2-polyprenyl-6-methoxyphenol hydroxylase-like FAD-dependent oxidoreductase
MTLRILVVGAGIAGLATARALRLAGYRPDVVEELPATMLPGAGIYLPGNASRALRQLGLDAPLRPLGALIFRQVFQDSRGRELFEMDVAGLWAGVGESRALPRADLQQVLLTSVGGAVRYDTAVRGLEIFDHTAKVEFGDGSVAEYDLVIGADGRRSTVRTKAGLGGAVTPTGQIVYRSVVGGGPALSDWTALLGRRSSFVVMPMGSRKLYCYADETAPDAPDPADPRARLRELFAEFGGPVPAILAAVEKVQVARTDEVVLDSWSRGPVLLVGDAAHATAPTLAQGAAMSFEDAVVLAEELRAASGDVPAALRSYETRRRPRCHAVRDRTRERDRTRDVPPALRDPMLRRRGLRIFSEHYGALVPPL